KPYRAHVPLERVHIDKGGPITPPTFGGKRHYELYVDEGSRFKWLFLLTSKSESFDNFKKFHVTVERQHDYKLKTIMTDNAKEYMSKELNAYCKGIGIEQLYTNPYSPEENCVVEKSNYSVMNKVRCILQASGMDKVYWGEALNYVVYTENRSPTKALGGKTPFEALYGRKPNIDHLRPFGCTAFAFIDKAKRTKLDPRAIKCVFVGYASQHKSYRLIDCDSGQLIQCRSVTFTEDSVPANDKKVQFNDQITTVPLQDYPSENVEVEDEEDVEAVSTHQQHSTQVSVGAPIVDTDRDPNASSQPSEGQVSDTDHEEHVSSDQESSDSDVEPENPTGLEAISGGRHQVLSVDTVNDAPQSFADIEASPNKQAWLDATHEEYDALVNNGTWVLTELPAGRKTLACKWLWRNKFDAVGHFTKYKARLVIKGFMQRYGLDYVEIFAPVLRYNTLRLVLFLVASNGWIIRQMDVKTAFLNGYLDEDTEIYMVQPPNFAVPGMEHLVCKLLKAIYGLKQAPRCWYLTLHEFLVSISFERCIKEVCLYIKRVGDSMVLLTGDDITITGNDNQEIEKACDALKERFEMTDL
ncbi:hypothetical protein As57867_019178, partial [Aphanomyces stellatus]